MAALPALATDLLTLPDLPAALGRGTLLYLPFSELPMGLLSGLTCCTKGTSGLNRKLGGAQPFEADGGAMLSHVDNIMQQVEVLRSIAALAPVSD